MFFPDSGSASDLVTFASRAAKLGAESRVRLQAAGGTIAMTTAILSPKGLLDTTPTILAMRALPVDPELVCDFVVAADELVTDPDDSSSVILPGNSVTAAWAGIAPPRGGWEPAEPIAASVVAARAQWGIAAVSDAMPQDAGEDIVHGVRASIWGVPDGELAGLPLGVAFAAFTMGFIAGDEMAPLRRAPSWQRLTFTRGHVLVRGPKQSGLTPVRTTGPR
nr:hypothetical protein [Microbacterium endophyticum]